MAADNHDDFTISGGPFAPSGSIQPPTSPTPPSPPSAQGTSRWATYSLVAGIAAWVVGPATLLIHVAFAGLAFPLAVLAIIFGVMGRRETVPPLGLRLGQGMALAGIILGIVYIGGAVVLPLLVILVCCMSVSSSSRGGSSGCGDCACGECGACDCGCGDCGGCDCGCGDCGCGDCGCGDCGGCACATAISAPLIAARVAETPLLPLLSPRAARWDSVLAHHPRTSAYAEDTYWLRGVRLCIGCFTTYPVFLVAIAILIIAAPAWPWWVYLALGGGATLAQVISALGLATRRWMKASVKTSLGLGLALLVHGTQLAPWSKPIQAVFLTFLVLASMASAIPRALRMRRACAACGAPTVHANP